MRRNIFLVLLLCSLLAFPIHTLAATAPVQDWDWLVKEVASGKASITLASNIVSDGETGLAAPDTVTIEGNGFALTGAIVDSGTVILKDVRVLGDNGIDEESGGPALTLRGDGAIAVLLGSSRAEGGRSGKDGETGGDAILMTGNGQGLILNNTTTAIGGIGRFYGGAGVRVTGCNAQVLATDSASLVGSPGLARGGDGLVAPSCCKVTLSVQGSVTGGASPYEGADGLHSLACEACEVRAAISMSGITMAIGGVGKDGGNGILLARSEAGEAADLSLADTCMLIGGDGGTAGSALEAANASIAYDGTPLAIGGSYYETESDAVALTDCTILGDEDALQVSEGEQRSTHPASDVSAIIHAALGQQSDRYVPVIIDDGLNTRDLQTKLNGFAVDRGAVNQVNISGNVLKIFMYTTELDARMNFQQRLMDDGEGGTRLVLIGLASTEWPTMESTVAGLQKLLSIGVTQLAYTCVDPVYHDQVLDLATLVAAIDAYEDGEVVRVMCGTADNAIIFILSDGTRDYQEELMPEVARPI